VICGFPHSQSSVRDHPTTLDEDVQPAGFQLSEGFFIAIRPDDFDARRWAQAQPKIDVTCVL
tara:strand:- start:163 stop:348 length:186 start_codon:yes stop_codon:yes gene_type:complete